jgi:phage tail-like protein
MPDQIIHYLPLIFQEAKPDSLLANLLAAFEKLLLGRDDDAPAGVRGLEQIIADLACYFDPRRAPQEFLPWLAGWVALTLRADLEEARQREVIARIVPLYRIRGTRAGLVEMIELFTEGQAEVRELDDLSLQIEVHSTVGVDTRLDGSPPHTFWVYFTPPADAGLVPGDRAARDRRLYAILQWVIEMAKPAHTAYTLKYKT